MTTAEVMDKIRRSDALTIGAKRMADAKAFYEYAVGEGLSDSFDAFMAAVKEMDPNGSWGFDALK